MKAEATGFYASNQTHWESPHAWNLCLGEGAEKAVVAELPLSKCVHPVVPPRVEYKLTPLGMSLGTAFCGVWIWAEENLDHVGRARRAFDGKAQTDRG